ncbi:copper chaperone PCu(A)C [Streptomyces spinoverrucosus]|uniref:copper chaperone PCu(A)C n=1 Tax=Streptomyces spinoverrucosus TaxID=284043 RepID=UPI0018C44F7A|nr:copper chaperone PCu(A)C [Streptomyces spinoverrucosus]MBG0853984.1 copper chaperone PCu(A)C [Streptomyces spinoverrucosus]
MRRTAVTAAALAGALALAGCGSSSAADSKADLSVNAAYMPQPVSDSMAAGFLTIANKGGTEDELTSVTSDIGEVTVHETVDSAMQEVKELPVPAHGELVLKSGGNHLMFERLKRKPKQGETVSVELHFAESEPVTVEMPVKSATYTPDSGH